MNKFEQEKYYEQKIQNIYEEYKNTHKKNSYTVEDCLIDLWVEFQELKYEALASNHFHGAYKVQIRIDTIDKIEQIQIEKEEQHKAEEEYRKIMKESLKKINRAKNN